ncbi:hypothetical protein [Streptomyces prunicolor]|uniref:hypothetical protein n=1 Tax=Streptomyces prunicolor TaxID=67348 RepID=UPI0003A60EED|nr:hypothetical protein [Streptomyces prunicolor]
MLQTPAIRCPRCQGAHLVANLIRYPCGATDVGSLACTRCAATWDAFETPAHAGPNYREAYDAAPDLFDEEYALLVLTENVKERAHGTWTGARPAVERWEHREVLLRKSAWLDRAAHRIELDWYRRAFNDEEVDQANMHAVAAAVGLLAFDTSHLGQHTNGSIRADSTLWNGPGGARAYVRQEYLDWREAEEEEADRGEFEARRGPDGDLYGPDGRAL